MSSVRRARQTFIAIAVAALALVGVVAPPPAIADNSVAPSPATLGVAKSVVEAGPFEPGQVFTYRIGYSCSSNTEPGCLDAVLTDELPANLELVSDPASLSTTRRVVVLDGSTLSVTFTDPLPGFGDGKVGLAVGNTVAFDMQVRFRSDAADADVARNCVSLTAMNAAPVSACADASAVVVPTTGADLTKTLSSTSGIATTNPRTTMTLTASVLGDVAATRLEVLDPTGGTVPFASFDLIGYGPVTLPDGVFGEVFIDDASQGAPANPIAATTLTTPPADGLRIVYTGDLRPGTSISFPTVLELRDERRPDQSRISDGSISNCASATATFDGRDPVTVGDRCATYTVIPTTPVASGSKSFEPASAVAGSNDPVGLVMTATNASEVAASTMQVTDPTNDAAPFSIFDFKGFTQLALPTGITATVDVLTGSGWFTLGSGLENGQTPNLGSTDPSEVVGVRYTYSGTIDPGQSITNRAQLRLRDTRRDSQELVAVQDYPDLNCMTVEVTNQLTDGSATTGNICAAFRVEPALRVLDGSKTFTPAQHVVGGAGTTLVTLNGRNSAASSAPVTGLVITEPGATSDPTFNTFDLVELRNLNAPASTTWRVEVKVGSAWTSLGDGFTNGQTPQLGVIEASEVVGIRYSLVTGELQPGEGLSTTFQLRLRDSDRASNTSVGAGQLTNRIDISSAVADDIVRGASFTLAAITGGNPSADKRFSPSSMVNVADTSTRVTLSGRVANNSNIPMTTLVLEDRPDSGFWSAFDFAGFRQLTVRSQDTNVAIEVFDRSTAAWREIGTYTNTTTASVLESAVVAVVGSLGNVGGVRATYTGNYQPNTNTTLQFDATLRADQPPGNVQNCMTATFDAPTIDPIERERCRNITIVAQRFDATIDKSFSSTGGVVGIDEPHPTAATLTIRNTGNMPLTSLDVVEPSNAPNPFTDFELVGFGALTLPSGVSVTIEVSTDGGTTTTAVGPHSDGQIPSLTDPSSVDHLTLHFTGDPGIPVSTGPNSNRMIVPLQLQLREGTGTGQFQNCAAIVTADPALVSPPATRSDCAVYSVVAQSPGAAVTKTWAPASGDRDLRPESQIILTARNSGNVPVDALVVTDPGNTDVGVDGLQNNAFDAFDLIGFGDLNLPSGIDQVQVDALRTDGTVATWTDGSPQATPVMPTGVDFDEVIGLRLRFTNSDGTTIAADSGTVTIRLDVELRSTLRSSGDPIPLGQQDNRAIATVERDGSPTTTPPALASYQVTAGEAVVVPGKDTVPSAGQGTPSYGPNETVYFRLRLHNSGTRNWVDPVVIDRFPTELVYDGSGVFPYPTAGYSFLPNNSTLAPPSKVTATDGELSFTFPDGAFLAPGQTAFLDLVFTVAPGTPAGTSITNTVGLSAANADVVCHPDTASSDFVEGSTFCIDSSTISVKTAKDLGSLKEIRGLDVPNTNVVLPGGPCPDDDGFTHYPCVAHTVVDGLFDYRLTVTNTSNIEFDRAIVIDVLPTIGDTGVIVGTARASEWTPTLAGEVSITGAPDSATTRIWYSTVDTTLDALCLLPITDANGRQFDDPACGDDWSTTPPADLAATTAIAVEVRYEVDTMKPLDSFRLSWQMRAPTSSPGAGAIAWNSFAFTGRPAGDQLQLLPAEPRKVGIVLDNPTVRVRKTTEPAVPDVEFAFELAPIQLASTADTPTDATRKTLSTSDDGTGTTDDWTDLRPGDTYRLTEVDIPVGWTSELVSCTDTRTEELIRVTDDGELVADAGAEIECVFRNLLEPTVRVAKRTIGSSDEHDFTFVLTRTDAADDEPITVALSTDEGSGTSEWTRLPIGAVYTIAEVSVDGWMPAFLGCVDLADDESVSASSTGVAGTIGALGPGAEIECVFENTRRPTIEVLKTTIGGNGTFTFSLSMVDPDEDATTDGEGEQLDSGARTIADPWEHELDTSTANSFTWPVDLLPGATYTVTEAATAGWLSTFDGCWSGETLLVDAGATGPAAHFVAEAGMDIRCKFTNRVFTLIPPDIPVPPTPPTPPEGTPPVVPDEPPVTSPAPPEALPPGIPEEPPANFPVAPEADAPTAPAPTPAPTPTPMPTTPQPGTLPRTGSSALQAATRGATLFVLAGAVILVGSRRRLPDRRSG